MNLELDLSPIRIYQNSKLKFKMKKKTKFESNLYQTNILFTPAT